MEKEGSEWVGRWARKAGEDWRSGDFDAEVANGAEKTRSDLGESRNRRDSNVTNTGNGSMEYIKCQVHF